MTRASWRGDPDDRSVRWGWTIWIAWGVIGGSLWLDDIRAGTGALSLVLVAPFWAAWLMWPMVRLLYAGWRWQRAGAWPVNAAYYEFDGRPIRILTRDGAIWVMADDVFDALGLRGRQRDAERVRQIAGRDGLTRPPGARYLAFSETGIKAWLDRRSDATASKFERWLDKQVIEPYRKRRTIDGQVDEPAA